MALSDILEQIKKETESKMESLNKEFDKKLKALEEDYENRKKVASEEMDEQVAQNSAKILNKMTTHAKMESKNKLLKEKRELMAGLFDAALEQLANSSNYQDLIVGLLKHTSVHGDDITICPPKGKEDVTRHAISAAGKDYKLCEKSLNIKGGFVLKSAKIEVDNSFESILNKQLKSDLELEVAKTLFV